jgi:hypothetical protein
MFKPDGPFTARHVWPSYPQAGMSAAAKSACRGYVNALKLFWPMPNAAALQKFMTAPLSTCTLSFDDSRFPANSLCLMNSCKVPAQVRRCVWISRCDLFNQWGARSVLL